MMELWNILHLTQPLIKYSQVTIFQNELIYEIYIKNFPISLVVPSDDYWFYDIK